MIFAEDPSSMPTSLCRYHTSIEDRCDLWLVFELVQSADPVFTSINSIHGGFSGGERIYEICQDHDHIQILEADNCRELKSFIRQVLQGLEYLTELGIVHSDLKSDNILLSFDYESRTIKDVKIIDFGTSMPFQDVGSCLQQTTPEYLPPEALEFIEQKTKKQLTDKLEPWSIDVWSLGIVLLELVTGFPMYMAYKGRIVRHIPGTGSQMPGHTLRSPVQTGLLASTTRQNSKILKLIT